MKKLNLKALSEAVLKGKETIMVLGGYTVLLLWTTSLAAQPVGKAFQPSPRMDIDKAVVVDTAHIRVSYALNADDLNEPATWVDWQYLEIGDSLSKYYSAFVSRNDSLVNAWQKAHPGSRSLKNWLVGDVKLMYAWTEYRYSEIFRRGGEQTVYVRMAEGLNDSDSWYAEPYPLQQWSIQGDTLTICGYVCQKAVCSFRGRDFVAWFAPDIPISEGPWTFGGLPGLILKVYDTGRLYTFECCGIERGCFPIRQPDYSRYRKQDRDKVLKLQRRINENYFQVAHIEVTHSDGTPMKKEIIPYEPLELE